MNERQGAAEEHAVPIHDAEVRVEGVALEEACQKRIAQQWFQGTDFGQMDKDAEKLLRSIKHSFLLGRDHLRHVQELAIGLLRSLPLLLDADIKRQSQSRDYGEDNHQKQPRADLGKTR